MALFMNVLYERISRYKPHVIHGTTRDVIGAVGSLFLRSSYPKDNVNSD